jgi:hypothetical protein
MNRPESHNRGQTRVNLFLLFSACCMLQEFFPKVITGVLKDGEKRTLTLFDVSFAGFQRQRSRRRPSLFPHCKICWPEPNFRKFRLLKHCRQLTEEKLAGKRIGKK